MKIKVPGNKKKKPNHRDGDDHALEYVKSPRYYLHQ